MELLTFKKGIYPPHNKYLTEDKEIIDMLPKEELVIPMLQHTGAPAVPVVQKGDRVLKGQKIGEANGKISSNVHSPVSGTVESTKQIYTSFGKKTLALVIENDGKYEEVKYPEKRDYNSMAVDEIIEAIKEAGVVGLGGAVFPTYFKLMPPKGATIDTIIVNGAECEPYLTGDYRLMLEKTNELIEGLKILLKIFPNAKGYIAVENNKEKAYKALKDAAKNEKGIEVCYLKTKYPQGSEKHLIYAITKREVPSGKLPLDVHCIVQNVGTVISVYQAVVFGEPVISRVVTVSGDAVKEPKNLRVSFGTSFKDAIEECGGFKEEPVKILSGGPMMGISLSNLDYPVSKNVTGIVALTKKSTDLSDETSCIRCGRCIDACPMNLMPALLDNLSRLNRYDDFKEKGGMNCIECGCCSYVCPAKRHITQSIKKGKLNSKK
ncbi:MAG TPA: electron transport complex subunit RsxC [Clostridiaceae bacterium]|jgi:electron transport complex protein RnfC|nr:electron transport complex subunit RsxC [Clostridiaceae bacterium]HBG39415.1 electron transport complex subunit RsxC [Clostridiaceae bacterium]HBN28574.1 electron transport complex subunit RsxC [Clostridiaceae bacterium]HBX48671.1 electron transport complex subunit RsxC [Clostridiaceae bacterium]HCL51460.1 electron transport complex subunit RsxC [Clostridiaceae bacterium]